MVRVEVVGTSKTEKKGVRLTFELIDFFDEKTNTTSMARTTGYTCAIACRILTQVEPGRGIAPVEEMFTGELYEQMKEELAARGMVINEKVEELDK